MARRHFQEGQVYEKGKNWIGRWRGDIVEADGKIRRIQRPAFSGPGSIMADSSTSKCIDDNTLSVLDSHVQDQVESKCQSNHTVDRLNPHSA